MAARDTAKIRRRGPREQTLSEEDQDASDQDRRDAERDQAASDRDQRAADRAHAVLDEALDRQGEQVARKEASEIHGATTRARLRSSRARSETALRREITASGRDTVASDRDAAAAQRDRAAEASDQEAEARADEVDHREELRMSGPAADVGEGVDPLAVRRRRRGSEDRRRAADERFQAAGDREAAARDRDHAQRHREQAAADRAEGGTDTRTGTLRRGVGLAALHRELERANRAETPLAIVFVDVEVLETPDAGEGAREGDRAIEAVADQISAELRSHDLVIRFGTNQLVCALPGARAADLHSTFEGVTGRLRTDPDGAPISIGFAELGPNDTAEGLIERAYTRLVETRRRRHSGGQT